MLQHVNKHFKVFNFLVQVSEIKEEMHLKPKLERTALVYEEIKESPLCYPKKQEGTTTLRFPSLRVSHVSPADEMCRRER